MVMFFLCVIQLKEFCHRCELHFFHHSQRFLFSQWQMTVMVFLNQQIIDVDKTSILSREPAPHFGVNIPD
jgi:phage-related holin